jgi:hypothetical protein
MIASAVLAQAQADSITRAAGSGAAVLACHTSAPPLCMDTSTPVAATSDLRSHARNQQRPRLAHAAAQMHGRK